MKLVNTLVIIMTLCAFIYARDGEFENYMKSEISAFTKFKEERDQEFTDYLKKQWEEFESFKGLVRDETPKPNSLPKVEQAEKMEKKSDFYDKVVSIKEESLKNQNTYKSVSVPDKIVSDVKQNTKDMIEFRFYGENIVIKYDKNMLYDENDISGNKQIAEFWEKSALSDFSILINSVTHYSDLLNLKSFGHLLFIKQISKIIYEDENRANLLSWFILSKLGYDVKVGIDNKTVYLLVPTEKILYGVTYFNLSGKKYYAIDTASGRKKVNTIKTYNSSYPGSTLTVSVKMENPKIKSSVSSRQLTFNYEKKEYTIDAKYDSNVVDYYKDYPQTELSVLMNAKPSEISKSFIKSQLMDILKGRSDVEAANIILRFVQTAFDYKTDIDQFGYEKYFMPEEIFFYPFSDCEDRAILYASLVKELLGLDVVLVDYPGHVATAVNLNSEIKGDYLLLDNKKYYIADPTYINSNIGMTMPLVSKFNPGVIFAD